LLDLGYDVYVVEELVFSSSRNVGAAIARMKAAGAVFLTYKSLYYELVEAGEGARHREHVLAAFGPLPGHLPHAGVEWPSTREVGVRGARLGGGVAPLPAGAGASVLRRRPRARPGEDCVHDGEREQETPRAGRHVSQGADRRSDQEAEHDRKQRAKPRAGRIL